MNDLDTRKALAQKYLDEYGITADYVSRHADSDWTWLAIATGDPHAAAIVRSVNDAEHWLGLAVAAFDREPDLAIDLRTHTHYYPRVTIKVSLVKENYS